MQADHDVIAMEEEKSKAVVLNKLSGVRDITTFDMVIIVLSVFPQLPY